MTTEQRAFVRMSAASAEVVAELHRLSIGALERSKKAPIGDRVDILRFERWQTELELLALVAWNGGAPTFVEASPARGERLTCIVDPEESLGDVSEEAVTWLRECAQDGAVVIECVTPSGPGKTVRPQGSGTIRPPMDPWESSSGQWGKAAVRERFLAQLDASVRNPATPIVPSGVSNSVLTEALRSYAARTNSDPAVLVPVAYRDGSNGRPFWLRALNLTDNRQHMGRVLTFSLLSIRHSALDALVDGAWLRNTDVSRPRPAGDTDEMVYAESVRQLLTISDGQPATIIMYQTGLDTAIVGFYRAVTEYLLTRSDLLVLPRYYQSDGTYAEGTAWRAE
ncbi:MAG: hypothetical protein K1X67_25360 [Fimbriimonadaceae bacterium]|nr:hypothetical protein [Fimbriimonadaceae bacterium]